MSVEELLSNNIKNETNNRCRICYDSDNDLNNPLIYPCKCTGTSKYIHKLCLKKWRMSNLPNSDPRNKCMECNGEYIITKQVLIQPLSIVFLENILYYFKPISLLLIIIDIILCGGFIQYSDQVIINYKFIIIYKEHIYEMIISTLLYIFILLLIYNINKIPNIKNKINYNLSHLFILYSVAIIFIYNYIIIAFIIYILGLFYYMNKIYINIYNIIDIYDEHIENIEDEHIENNIEVITII